MNRSSSRNRHEYFANSPEFDKQKNWSHEISLYFLRFTPLIAMALRGSSGHSCFGYQARSSFLSSKYAFCQNLLKSEVICTGLKSGDNKRIINLCHLIITNISQWYYKKFKYCFLFWLKSLIALNAVMILYIKKETIQKVKWTASLN
jgi:hypothetical protein